MATIPFYVVVDSYHNDSADYAGMELLGILAGRLVKIAEHCSSTLLINAAIYFTSV